MARRKVPMLEVIKPWLALASYVVLIGLCEVAVDWIDRKKREKR